MKNIKLILFLILISAVSYAQNSCDPPTGLSANVDIQDVQLSWNAPAAGSFMLLSESIRDKVSKNTDASPTIRNIANMNPNRDFMDLQFSFPCVVATGEAGVETDGQYFFVASWNSDTFYLYEMDGTYSGSFTVTGARYVRDMAYVPSTGYFYGSDASNNVFVMDFYNYITVDTITSPVKARAIAYNDDNDSFYTNNWSDNITEFDRQTGATLSSFPVGVYTSYYGFAYDNWTDGGPFLWGFSQDGSGAELVQIQLPGGNETGLVVNVMPIVGGSQIAGGLFTHPDIIPGKVTIGGMLQNELIFGLELADTQLVHVFAGYNIYKDDVLLNSNPQSDTTYFDTGLNPGSYQYKVTAVYNDTQGAFLCESDPAGPVTAVIHEQMLLGGNVFAGIYKLDEGNVSAYKVEGPDITLQSTTPIDDLGYYFFFPLITKHYYVHASPDLNSSFLNNYVPTYYGDKYHWEDANTIMLANNIYNADIKLIELVPYTSGSGYINGFVYEVNKGVNTGVVSGVLMLLLNSSGECIAKTYSNDNGWFEFGQLGDGSYKLLCEVAGKKMIPQNITINTSNPYFENMSLIIQDDEVVMGIQNPLPATVTYVSDILPNPVKDKAKVNIELKNSQLIRYSILDISGKNIFSTEKIYDEGSNSIDINTSALSQGLYFLRIEFDGKQTLNLKFVKY